MDFTEIAMQKLGQTAPELTNLIVAFRDISEESSAENDVSVGVFILRSGPFTYFVPVIQKDYTVHPIDSVFFCQEGKFRPLSKSTVSQIINSGKLEPGKKTKVPKGVSRNPSVYDLVNPPRTGKFVYASEGRMIEFLASLPNHVKAHLKGRLSENTTLANKIHGLYGIADFLAALKEDRFENKETSEVPAKAVLSYGDALEEAQAREVLEKGYFLNTSFPHANRMAIPQEEFEYHGQLHQISTATSEGKCFRMLLPSGLTTNCYILKEAYGSRLNSGSRTSRNVVITESGEAHLLDRFIAVGDELTGEKSPEEESDRILNSFSRQNPVGSVEDLEARDGNVIILTPEFRVVATGGVEAITILPTCTKVSVNGSGCRTVTFMKGLATAQKDQLGNIHVPFLSPVIQIKSLSRISWEIERLNINLAQSMLAMQACRTLEQELRLSHDGVDFAIDGASVGPIHKAIEILVVREGIPPVRAESLVKKAQAEKSVRVLMSKKADFSPGQIPEFGEKPSPQSPSIQEAAVSQALDAGDRQIADAMIISELLQSPDLFSVVSEYLPDISEAVDRLGRILFLSRVRMDQLAEKNGSESALSTIASVKAVYRNLGDNLVKLEQLLSNVSAT